LLWDEPKIFFLERRYFFSIILSEFLKNRVALQLGFFILTGGKDDGNLRHDPLQTHSSALPRLSAGTAAGAGLQPFAGM
jgi:hypothetical protein